jgi:multidrug resistance efflux pump
LVKVGSNNSGRIIDMNVDIGTTILEGQVIATVDIATVVSKSEITGTSKIGFRNVQDQLAEVLAPRSGIIADLRANEGDTVSAGQAIVTLIDPRQVWVLTNIDEGSINRVLEGQIVEIKVDSFGGTLLGKVEKKSPATVAVLQSGQTNAGDFDKGDQVVPVKIALDGNQPALIAGSTASIKIRTR